MDGERGREVERVHGGEVEGLGGEVEDVLPVFGLFMCSLGRVIVRSEG